MKLNNKGFTLIELLIVIALLGALAVGLLAALDPFEQLKKGTDTGIRNTVSEIHGAVVRYYSIRNEMPWVTSGQPGDMSSTLAATAYTNAISPIVSTGELKSDFSSLAGTQLNSIFMMGTAESVTVCFKPTSKAMRSDPNTKYDNTGTDLGTNNVANCGSPSATTFSCYWCVK